MTRILFCLISTLALFAGPIRADADSDAAAAIALALAQKKPVKAAPCPCPANGKCTCPVCPGCKCDGCNCLADDPFDGANKLPHPCDCGCEETGKCLCKNCNVGCGFPTKAKGVRKRCKAGCLCGCRSGKKCSCKPNLIQIRQPKPQRKRPLTPRPRTGVPFVRRASNC